MRPPPRHRGHQKADRDEQAPGHRGPAGRPGDEGDEGEDQGDRPHIEGGLEPGGLLSEPVGILGAEAKLTDQPGQRRLEPVRGGIRVEEQLADRATGLSDLFGELPARPELDGGQRGSPDDREDHGDCRLHGRRSTAAPEPGEDDQPAGPGLDLEMAEGPLHAEDER